jgi:hypothetical protein
MHPVDHTGKTRLLMKKAIEARATANCQGHSQKMTGVAETTDPLAMIGQLEMIDRATMSVPAETMTDIAAMMTARVVMMIATVETRTLIDAVATKSPRIAAPEGLDGERTRSHQAGLVLPSPRKISMAAGSLMKTSLSTCRSSIADPLTMAQTALEAHGGAEQMFLAGTTTL